MTGLLGSMAAVPLAAVRGLPWLGRSITITGRTSTWWPLFRTTTISPVLVLVFGALFASADALFARWVDQWVGALVPDLNSASVFVRVFVLATVFGPTATGAYVALTPPRVERLALPQRRPERRFEWVVPVGVVTAVFAVFPVAQLTAMLAGTTTSVVRRGSPTRTTCTRVSDSSRWRRCSRSWSSPLRYDGRRGHRHGTGCCCARCSASCACSRWSSLPRR